MSLCNWFNAIINPHPMQLEMSSHISKSNCILFKEGNCSNFACVYDFINITSVSVLTPSVSYPSGISTEIYRRIYVVTQTTPQQVLGAIPWTLEYATRTAVSHNARKVSSRQVFFFI